MSAAASTELTEVTWLSIKLSEEEENSPIRDNIHYQQLVSSLFEQSSSKFELLRKCNRAGAERRHSGCCVNYSCRQNCTKSPYARKFKSHYDYSREMGIIFIDNAIHPIDLEKEGGMVEVAPCLLTRILFTPLLMSARHRMDQSDLRINC